MVLSTVALVTGLLMLFAGSSTRDGYACGSVIDPKHRQVNVGATGLDIPDANGVDPQVINLNCGDAQFSREVEAAILGFGGLAALCIVLYTAGTGTWGRRQA
jgi:hypothetical protein